MNTADTPRNIAEVLTYLTEGGRRISDNALAREVDLPQPTITRIRNGTTAEPRSDAIEKLAAYFGLSAAQMRGEARCPASANRPKRAPNRRPMPHRARPPKPNLSPPCWRCRPRRSIASSPPSPATWPPRL